MNVLTRLSVGVITLVFLLLGSAAFEALNAQTLRNQWGFDGTLDDTVGTNNAIGAEPPYVVGFDCSPGGAAAYDGVRTNRIDNIGDNLLPADFSITAWVRVTGNGPPGGNFWQGGGIYYGEVGGVVPDAGLVMLVDKAAFGIGGTTDVTVVGKTAIVDGTWHHVAGVRETTAEGSNLTLYVDGRRERSFWWRYDRTSPHDLDVPAGFALKKSGFMGCVCKVHG